MELKLDDRKVDAEERISTSLRPVAKAFPQSPPSSSSSPTHDFEFTISFGPSGSDNLAKLSSASLDVDLNPPDDLFYQGHLLPLHHNLFSTPRTSCSCTHHCDSIPREAGEEGYHDETNRVRVAAEADLDQQRPPICRTTGSPTTGAGLEEMKTSLEMETARTNPPRTKPKSFSLLTLKKGSKLGFKSAKDVIERYVKTVKPFFMRKSKEAEDARRGNLERQRWNRYPSSHSFSSNQRYPRSSATCSAITSPGNSGILYAIPSSSESTMEDLQNAIQAAISHCKNSINAVKEEGKIDQR